MVANQILLRTIEGIKEQSGIDLAVFDDSGNVLAATYSDTDEQSRKVVEFAGTEDEEAESASADPAPETPPAPTPTEALLAEIRDELKARKV